MGSNFKIWIFKNSFNQMALLLSSFIEAINITYTGMSDSSNKNTITQTPNFYLFKFFRFKYKKLIRKKEEKKEKGEVHGCRVYVKEATVLYISHLLFAGDSFYSSKQASVEECSAIKTLLNDYEMISRQAINFQKSSIFFSANLNASVKNSISGVLGV